MQEPTPGTTGDAGDADQAVKGEVVSRLHQGREQFLYHGRWVTAFSGGAPEGGEEETPTPGGPSGESETYSKADLEKILQARIAAERKKYADYDDLKSKAEEWAKHEDAQKSEIEKANERAAAAEKEREDARVALRTERAKNVVTEVATGLKFVNPSVAYKLLDAESIDHDDDGRPTKESVKKALESLAESEPYLVGQRSPRGDGGGGPRGPSSPNDINAMIRRKAGRAS